MVDVLGKSYIIDHCYTYCKHRGENEALRTYVTDALKAIVHNTAGLRKDSMTLQMRFDDLITKSQKQEEETQSGEEIIAHFKDKMRNFEKGGKPDGLDVIGRKADA